jgi:hypothetical protein
MRRQTSQVQLSAKPANFRSRPAGAREWRLPGILLFFPKTFPIWRALARPIALFCVRHLKNPSQDAVKGARSDMAKARVVEETEFRHVIKVPAVTGQTPTRDPALRCVLYGTGMTPTTPGAPAIMACHISISAID